MRQVGPYEFGAVIGDGGMGTVYAGVDTRFGRQVAIKLLHPHLARNPDVVRRFRTEAVIGAKLSHPHIVRVYDVVEGEGLIGFVMEHVDGYSLDQFLEIVGGRLPPDEVMKLLRQVVSGVAHAHASDLVHRDIKPSNVLVEVVDGELNARVTDFGVAKVLGGETHLTGMGAKIGTLAYMSPEQIEDPASVDARSDVYSLGVLAYELLTGVVPFEADTEFEAMRKILAGERRRIEELWPHVPAGLAAVVKRCLDVDRNGRYRDARELHRALGALAAGGAAAMPQWSPQAVAAPPGPRAVTPQPVPSRAVRPPVAVAAPAEPPPPPPMYQAARSTGHWALARAAWWFDPPNVGALLTGLGLAFMLTFLLPGRSEALLLPAWGLALLVLAGAKPPHRIAMVALLVGAVGLAVFYWDGQREPDGFEFLAAVAHSLAVMLCSGLLAGSLMGKQPGGRWWKALATLALVVVAMRTILFGIFPAVMVAGICLAHGCGEVVGQGAVIQWLSFIPGLFLALATARALVSGTAWRHAFAVGPVAITVDWLALRWHQGSWMLVVIPHLGLAEAVRLLLAIACVLSATMAVATLMPQPGPALEGRRGG